MTGNYKGKEVNIISLISYVLDVKRIGDYWANAIDSDILGIVISQNKEVFILDIYGNWAKPPQNHFAIVRR